MFKYKYREKWSIRVKVQPNSDKIVVEWGKVFESFYKQDSRYFEEVKEEKKDLPKKSK